MPSALFVLEIFRLLHYCACVKGAHTDILVMLPCSRCTILSWANPFSREKGSGQLRQHHDFVLHTQQLASSISNSMLNLPLNPRSPRIKKCRWWIFLYDKWPIGMQDLTKGSNSHTKMFYSYKLQIKLLTLIASPCSMVQVARSRSTNFWPIYLKICSLLGLKTVYMPIVFSNQCWQFVGTVFYLKLYVNSSLSYSTDP